MFIVWSADLHDLVADVHGPGGVRGRAEADVGELVVAAERRHHVEAQRAPALAQHHRVQRRALQDHRVRHVLRTPRPSPAYTLSLPPERTPPDHFRSYSIVTFAETSKCFGSLWTDTYMLKY